MTLGNYSSASFSTPVIAEYIYDLPPDNDGSQETLTTLDYFMIVLAFLSIILAIAYFLYKLLGKKKRRRVSFEGERVASNIVGSMTEINNEDRAYYQ
jgi:hypothetical protein